MCNIYLMYSFDFETFRSTVNGSSATPKLNCWNNEFPNLTMWIFSISDEYLRTTRHLLTFQDLSHLKVWSYHLKQANMKIWNKTWIRVNFFSVVLEPSTWVLLSFQKETLVSLHYLAILPIFWKRKMLRVRLRRTRRSIDWHEHCLAADCTVRAEFQPIPSLSLSSIPIKRLNSAWSS